MKFSVRCSTGTAAAWTNVYHEDGPTNPQVDDVCCPAAAH
ncbi:LPD29 domain-containing protein [Curtobacterium sp. ME12]